MADTVRNPYAYTSPIGESLANLTRTLMSGPSSAERIKAAEEALKLKTQREGISKVSDLFGQYGQPGFNRNAAMSAAVLGGYDPSDLSALDRYGAANTFGATDPRTVNAQVGAGDAYSSTAPAFFTNQNNENTRAANTLAESARQFNQTPQPSLVNGAPAFVPREGAFATGVSPILSDTENKATLANKNWANLDTLSPAQKDYVFSSPGSGQSPKNYIGADGKTTITYDGVTDAQTGARLAPGGHIGTIQGSASETGLTTATTTDLQKNDIANQQFSKLLDYTESLVKQNPANIGASGIIKNWAQDAAQLAGNVSQQLGYNGINDAVDAVRANAQANGINPGILSGIFDPTLPKLETAYDLLVYSAASALAGQQSRSVSDYDIKIIKNVVGSPNDFFGSQQKALAKLGTLRDILGMKQGVVDEALGKPGAPAAAPAPAGVEENWIRGPDNKLMRAP